jgi:hypothetical protein
MVGYSVASRLEMLFKPSMTQFRMTLNVKYSDASSLLGLRFQRVLQTLCRYLHVEILGSGCHPIGRAAIWHRLHAEAQPTKPRSLGWLEQY